MKKITILGLLLFAIVKGYSQDYLISFAGIGASATFDSVKVENLMQNTSIIVPDGNQLRLKADYSGINSINDDAENALRIYPNPAKGYSIVEFETVKSSDIKFDVFDLSGRQVAQKQSNLLSGKHSYRISGLSNGVYIVYVKTEDFNYSGKIISQCGYQENAKIYYNAKTEENKSSSENKLKSADAEITMQYTTGDRLKFTGISGVYSTVITDITTDSKTVTFNFVGCTDGDNNNYPVVNIGTQTWMAENLKYLPSIVGPGTGSDTTPYYYVYGYDGTNVTEAKATANYTTYGVLYNWPAAMNGAASSTANPSGVQGVCPTGWHLPSDAEWTSMENYLITNGYNYDGSTTGNKYAKALASATGWVSYTVEGTVGNTDYPAKRNATGFTALPGGYRHFNGLLFLNIGSYGHWWTSSEYLTFFAWFRYMYYDYSNVYSYGGAKGSGFSVRCVRDN
jgi:uncharacterized protein (TIGR02145 family)